MNLAEKYSPTSEKRIQDLLNFNSKKEQCVIDRWIQKLEPSLNSPEIILTFLSILDELREKVIEKMTQDGVKEIKEELVALISKHLFWDKFSSNDREKDLQEIEGTLALEDSMSLALGHGLGKVLFHHLSQLLNQHHFSIFSPIISLYPQITEEEIIKFLGEVFQFDSFEVQEINEYGKIL